MFTQHCDSVTVVHGDQIAVGVGEGEHPAEGAVDGWNRDRHAVGEQLVVQFLGVGGVQPRATPSPGRCTLSRSTPGSGSRNANGIGAVANTIAPGGLADARVRPRCWS